MVMAMEVVIRDGDRARARGKQSARHAMSRPFGPSGNSS